MRFLNTTTHHFQEIPDSEVQSLKNGYAILSHRWGDEEVTFEDITSLQNVEARKGYSKLEGVCKLASSLGYDLVWIDTCCINKESSTELAEAINSMYRWYAQANVCIAYLEDVGPGRRPLEQSEWFDRGWTLQELIAPRSVSFYNYNWVGLGSKTELLDILSTITGIPSDVLSNNVKPQTYSIAQRMSWAAGRKTTRIEDRAYSLLGLFDIGLPMIYGEQERAFTRLQEEIIKKSADESIFCWEMPSGVDCAGLLATSPDAFKNGGQLSDEGTSRGFAIDQFGFKVEFQVASFEMEIYLAFLSVSGSKQSHRYGICLSRRSGKNEYVRVKTHEGQSVFELPAPFSRPYHPWKVIRVPQEPSERPRRKYPGFWLRNLNVPTNHKARPVLFSRRPGPKDRMSLPAGLHDGLAGVLLWLSHSSTEVDGWFETKPTEITYFFFDSVFRPQYCLTKTKRGVKHDNAGQLHPETWDLLSREVYGTNYYASRRVLGHGRNSVRTADRSSVYGEAHVTEGLSLHLNKIFDLEIRLCPDPVALLASPGKDAVEQDVWTIDIVFGEDFSLKKVVSDRIFR